MNFTAREFRILDLLIERHGRVQTRERLRARRGDEDADVSERAIAPHIKRLREKLGPAAPWLETVRGIGGRFRDPGDHPTADTLPP